MSKTLDRIEEFRRNRLQELVVKHGSIAKLAENLNVTPGYISQLLNKHRPITEKTARKIESSLRLEENWLDPKSTQKGVITKLISGPNLENMKTTHTPGGPGAVNDDPSGYINKLLSMATPNSRKKLEQIAKDNANGLLTDEDIEELHRIAEYLKMKRNRR